MARYGRCREAKRAERDVTVRLLLKQHPRMLLDQENQNEGQV
jgi:hypothetical protein